MNSKILNYIGMGSIDPAFYIIGLLVLIVILLIINIVSLNKIKKLRMKYDSFLMGKNAETLEDSILTRFDELDKLSRDNKQKSGQISDIKENLKIVYQKCGIVKYDAFNEMGGKLSFSLALLNDNNTGFVINAMHSREGCYTYIKEIINGESYIPLGEEEKQAVKKAIDSE